MLINHPVKWGIACAAVYLALACWAMFSYEDPAPNGAVVVQLLGPFVHELGFAWRVGQLPPHDAARLTHDSVIYEERRALDRAEHFRGLSEVPGRFLYERGVLLFSVKDDPNRNGRKYWAVVSN